MCPISWTASIAARRASVGLVRAQAVELGAQPRQRDDGDRPPELRLPVDEAQHRHEQVALGDPEQPEAPAGTRASSVFRNSAELHCPRAGE